METSTKRKIGRPRKLGLKFEIKKKISKTLEAYFTSEEFQRDIILKTGNQRLRTHLNLLPYVLPKAESIKAQMLGLDEREMRELVQSVKVELSKQS
ncbi:hypothetical protein [Winogradskyella sp.]|uniref:hypothetical protein n=1 Tax=Winogradskyella sp. TaxID=1883156 RepID=UPI001B1C64ED|nr:hypothetical protein [Winogradskyella sp.]MBO6881452.1 hypothetical protein [Winogradskyella sp.]